MRINTGTCRGCGAPILWIHTPLGRNMPCDPELLTYWQKPGGREKIVTPNGEVLSAELEGPADQATGVGYRSHFASCTRSEDFRRKR